MKNEKGVCNKFKILIVCSLVIICYYNCCVTGVDADVCPEGHYCPTGTTNPVACPKGTYSNSTGLEAAIDCVKCDPGQYCDQLGLTEPSGPCSAG